MIKYFKEYLSKEELKRIGIDPDESVDNAFAIFTNNTSSQIESENMETIKTNINHFYYMQIKNAMSYEYTTKLNDLAKKRYASGRVNNNPQFAGQCAASMYEAYNDLEELLAYQNKDLNKEKRDTCMSLLNEVQKDFCKEYADVAEYVENADIDEEDLDSLEAGTFMISGLDSKSKMIDYLISHDDINDLFKRDEKPVVEASGKVKMQNLQMLTAALAMKDPREAKDLKDFAAIAKTATDIHSKRPWYQFITQHSSWAAEKKAIKLINKAVLSTFGDTLEGSNEKEKLASFTNMVKTKEKEFNKLPKPLPLNPERANQIRKNIQLQKREKVVVDYKEYMNKQREKELNK